MGDVIIIPTHERPEFLHITLENIAKASHLKGKSVWVCEDIHTDNPKTPQLQEEIISTVLLAHGSLPIEHFQVRHTNHGSSFNVLESFRRACDTDADMIYFIEDDVIVTPDFFRFCEAVHNEWDPFATGPNCSPQSKTNEDPSLIEASSTWMQTFAMSFQRERLKELLLPKYENYGLLKQGERYFEWDEWLCKAMQRSKQYIINPIQSRGFHFGVYSYHTGGGAFPGNLAERIAQTRAVIANPSSVSGINATRDIKERIPTSPYEWSKLRKHGWRTTFPNRGPRNRDGS